MQELELTWGQVVRIWWAAMWRWFVLANLSVGVGLGLIGIFLWTTGIRWLPLSFWIPDAILIFALPAVIMALRLALKAKYKGFRIAIVAQPKPEASP